MASDASAMRASSSTLSKSSLLTGAMTRASTEQFSIEPVV
jgi:hypothetical protein